MQWLAIYSGNSLSNAKLIAFTCDTDIIRGTARNILNNINQIPPGDSVSQAIEEGRKRALETIAGHVGQ